MKHVVVTGNVGNDDQISELKSLAPNFHMVRGDFDEDTSLPEHKIISIGQFKIGLVHGHQIVPWGDHGALAMMQRQQADRKVRDQSSETLQMLSCTRQPHAAMHCRVKIPLRMKCEGWWQS